MHHEHLVIVHLLVVRLNLVAGEARQGRDLTRVESEAFNLTSQSTKRNPTSLLDELGQAKRQRLLAATNRLLRGFGGLESDGEPAEMVSEKDDKAKVCTCWCLWRVACLSLHAY